MQTMPISLKLIAPSPHPIRTSWDEDKLNELARTIQEQGVIVPIKVRPMRALQTCRYHGLEYLSVDGTYDNATGYGCERCVELQAEAFGWTDEDDTEPAATILEIVDGHRRVEASRRAGCEWIYASVEPLDDKDTLVQAIIANIQREDMTPLDTARGLKALQDLTEWSLGEIERKGLFSKTYAFNLLSLLKEPEPVRRVFQENDNLTERHVRETRQVLTADSDKLAVLEKAASEGLTAVQTRRVAEAVAAAPSPEAKAKLIEWDYNPTFHNPEMVKERAEQFGAHDPLYRDNKPSPAKDWNTAPEVIGVIDTIKAWRKQLDDAKRTADIGKMSPEARSFIARRVSDFAASLASWALELEQPRE